MFRNSMPRYELLSEEALATLDGGWRRLVSEIGVEFDSDRALELFRAAGQKVEDARDRVCDRCLYRAGTRGPDRRADPVAVGEGRDGARPIFWDGR